MKANREKFIVYGPEWTPDGTRERYRWVENASRGLRVHGPAHDIAGRRIRGMGWCMDPCGEYGRDGEGLAVGYVLQLPGRDRRPRYVPAVLDDCNPDCYVVDFHNMHDDAVECAGDADHMAECYADREREYRLADMAENEISELRAEALELRRQHRAAIADMRALRAAVMPGNAPTACRLLRDKLADMRARVRECLQRAATLADEPWKLLEG